VELIIEKKSKVEKEKEVSKSKKPKK